MSKLTPFQFRPMDQLTEECRRVEMALRETGEVVTGWLFCGVPRVPRSFWMQGPRGTERIDPIGWRDPPTPAAIAAWKAEEERAGKARAA